MSRATAASTGERRITPSIARIRSMVRFISIARDSAPQPFPCRRPRAMCSGVFFRNVPLVSARHALFPHIRGHFAPSGRALLASGPLELRLHLLTCLYFRPEPKVRHELLGLDRSPVLQQELWDVLTPNNHKSC